MDKHKVLSWRKITDQRISQATDPKAQLLKIQQI